MRGMCWKSMQHLQPLNGIFLDFTIDGRGEHSPRRVSVFLCEQREMPVMLGG